MLWKDLFPTREEYASRGGSRINPPGGSTEPAGTRRMGPGGQIIESTGKPGIMWRVVGQWGKPGTQPRCPICGQIIQQPNVSGSLRKLL